MIGQRHSDAVLQLSAGKRAVCWKGDFAVSHEIQRLIIMATPCFNQRGLTWHEEASMFTCLVPTEAERGTGFGRMRQIGRLAPFQRLFELTDLRRR